MDRPLLVIIYARDANGPQLYGRIFIIFPIEQGLEIRNDHDDL